MNFLDEPTEAPSVASMRQLVFTDAKSVNAYYREISSDRISLTGDVFGWFTLSANSAPSCDYSAFKSMATQMAMNDGVDLANYDHVIYGFNWASTCDGFGLADISGKTIQIAGDFSLNDTPTYIHELGHNLGLHHARSLTCVDDSGVAVTISEKCTALEYGDTYDQMGGELSAQFAHFSNWRLEQLGILTSSNIETITKSGTYSLVAARNSTTTEVASLRIPRTTATLGQQDGWYELEIRQAGGNFESTPNAFHNGVAIRIVASKFPAPRLSFFAPSTFLLDANPQSSHFLDAPLQVGQTVKLETWSFASQKHNVSITTLEAANGKAQVRIDFPDIESPTPPSSLKGAVDPNGVSLHWTASTDNVGVDHYEIYRDGSKIDTSSSTAFVDKTLPVGTHSYKIRAVDQAGNRSDPSLALLLNIADFVSPTRPLNLVGAAEVKHVSLGWTASTDNVRVRNYLIFRDGALVGTSQSTAFTDTTSEPGLRIYTVYAEDGAGNRSGSSDDLHVQVPKVTSEPAKSSAAQKANPRDHDRRPPRLKVWHRRVGAQLLVQIEANDDVRVARVSLWANGRLIDSQRGSFLQASFRPLGPRSCQRLSRIVARARDASGKKVSQTLRIRSTPLITSRHASPRKCLAR